MSLRKISAQELREVLHLHRLWLNNDCQGQKANFHGVDLSGINLQNAYLHAVDLSSADLQGANLRNSYFLNANLSGANLQRANLQDAVLQGADLRGANFQGANLQGVELEYTDLRGTICDSSVQNAWSLAGSMWLHSDIPWWLGHEDQCEIVLCDQ